MKSLRILCAALITALLLTNGITAFADMPDFSAMSNEEILSVILAAREELNSRNLGEKLAAGEILQNMKDAGLDLEITEIFNEDTDLNHLLGRPGQYIGKVDFSIGNVAKNTIETFSSAEDCEARYEYLDLYTDASRGAFGLNQYMYKSEFAILRISYDLAPSAAAEYEAAFYALVGQGK